jgi:hypothetical protein
MRVPPTGIVRDVPESEKEATVSGPLVLGSLRASGRERT